MSTQPVPQPQDPIIQMVQDPDFGKMAVSEQRKALSAHDPIFQNAGDDAIGQFVQAHQPATQNQQQPDSFLGGVGQRLKDIAMGQQPQTIGDALKNAPWFGPIPQALAGVAKNIKQLGPQVVQQAKQAAASHQPGDVLPNLYDARTAVTAASMLDPFASGSVANVNQLQDQGRPRQAAGQGLTDAALLAAGEGVGRGIPAIRDALPGATKARAGALFNEASAAAGDQPIDVSNAGNQALKIRELSEAGGAQPKVIRDFIRRTTDPNQPPLTYDEARDFYSNATRISADEAQRLTPVMRYNLQQFTRQLGDAIGNTADQAGVGPQYQGAMSQYARAMRMQDFIDWLKQGAVKAAIGTAGGGIAGYGLKRILEGATKK